MMARELPKAAGGSPEGLSGEHGRGDGSSGTGICSR